MHALAVLVRTYYIYQRGLAFWVGKEVAMVLRSLGWHAWAAKLCVVVCGRHVGA